MALPDYLRDFSDTKTTRKWLMDDTLASLGKRFPIEDKDYRLELSNIRPEGPQDFGMARQKNALMRDEQLRIPIKGTWKLTHKESGQILDEKDDTVMHLPYLTDRGTMLYGGNEYSVTNQSRLKPGVYTRKKKSGEIESFFNVKAGTGRTFRVWLEPKTGVFKVNIGQSNIPLYPLMQSMGVKDTELSKAWGGEILAANAAARQQQAIEKYYERFTRKLPTAELSDQARRDELSKAINGAEVDEGVVARTLGLAGHKNVSSAMLLRSTQKMLNISKGQEEPDDRDAPMFSRVMGIEDHIRERIDNDAGKIARTLIWKIRRDRNLKRVQPGVLNPYVEGYMFGSRLTMPLEETNPLALLEQAGRITKLGEGGIADAQSVTDEARNVNIGQLGFVDPISGPEGCWRPDAEVMTRDGWVRWDAVTAQTEFACRINNKLEYRKAEALHVYEWDGPMYGAMSKFIHYLVTPKHRIWTRPYDDTMLPYRFESADYTHGRPRMLCTGGHIPYSGAELGDFALPTILGGNALKSVTSVPIVAWAEFMGWFLSEGSTYARADGQIQVTISQHDGPYVPALKSALSCIPVVWQESRYRGKLDGFITVRKQLGEYLRQFGCSHDKFIPACLFDAPVAARRALLHALCMGDGRKKGATFTYCTSSRRLALDVERLAFSLGYSVRVRFEKDTRPQSLTGGIWCVHLHLCNERVIVKGHRTQKGHYYTEHYTGKVYCATVPGGLMYCRYGDYGGHWSGNTNIGIDVRASYRTFKGRDQQMYAEFKDAKTGKLNYLKPEDMDGKVVAFPGEIKKGMAPGSLVTAVKGGKLQEVPFEEVDLEVPSFAHMMSANTNLNPMPTSVQAARQFYGAKFWTQYMPQVQGDIPNVDSLTPDGNETFSEHYGKKIGAITSDFSGQVVKVTDDAIIARDAKGQKREIELVKDFPFNRLSGITYTSSVKPGDAIEPGQILAASNFADAKTGSLKLGRNLSIAIIPFRGHSYEDAYVISASAAKKLTTQRLYGFDQEAKHEVELDKNKYVSLFPSIYTNDQLANLDDDGIVKPGAVLHKGDPVILAVGPKLLTPEDVQLGKLHKALRNAHTDKSTIWDHDYPGIVTDAARTRSGAKVNIKAEVPVQPGDKLSTRFGLKGVVGEIVDDDKMPRDAGTNKPYDVLMNPMGILSRVAAGQLIEAQLGKVADRTGKQIRLPQLPPDEGWNSWAMKQLEDAGIPEKETVFDPELGRNITKPVATGNVYIMAFHHLSEKKLSERGAAGLSYTMDELPSRGGSETQQAKKMSSMDLTQLLAHGANDVIYDSQVIRGARNDEYWKALKLGRPLPEPHVPFVYNKFLNLLKAGGININQKGDILQLMPMTDDDVSALSHGEVTTSAMLDDKFEPIAGGLFDPGRTGGANGKNWTHIKLNSPMPNPVFEEPIRRLLGLRQKDLFDIVSGKQELNGVTGGEAIQAALNKLDIDAEISKHKDNMMRLRGSNRDNAIKALGYLTSAKKQGIHPSAWVISKVPVLPPVFRPVSRLGDLTLEADLNELYRDLVEVNNNIGELRKNVPDSSLHEEKAKMYHALSAVVGLGDPVTAEGRSKRLSGAVRTVIGTSPKFGFFQSRVMSKPVDLVGRGVVTPDPNLDMDSIGIPEASAWSLYKNFVIRKLVQQNIPAHKALEMIEKREPQALSLLQDEMSKRPVIVDRAPTWHKFNLLAFHPHIVKGNTVRVSPLITKGFTMDFDGDAVNFHVPVSAKAVSQSNEKMLPSKNLFSLTDLHTVRHSPQQELALGLYMLTRKASSKPVQKFASAAEARRAYNAGKIDANDPIEIVG